MPKLTEKGKTKIISILCQSIRRWNRWPDSEHFVVGSFREITITIAEIQDKLSSNDNLSGYEIEYLAKILWKELILQEISQNPKIYSGKELKLKFSHNTNEEDRRRINDCFARIVENYRNQQPNNSDLIDFLNDQYCEDFYLPKGSFRTCQRFLQASANQSQSFETVNSLVKTVNNLAQRLTIDIVDISDFSLFEYQQKDFNLKCIRPIREQSLQNLRNILSDYNQLPIVGSIQQYYLEQSGWKTQRRQQQNDSLSYLSDPRKNQGGEETTLLRYVAHLIQSTNNDLTEELTNWLTVKGCFFSQNSQEFDAGQFLEQFTIPRNMNPAPSNPQSLPQSFLMISFKKLNDQLDSNYQISCWFASENQPNYSNLHQYLEQEIRIVKSTDLKQLNQQLTEIIKLCILKLDEDGEIDFSEAIYNMRIELFIDYTLLNLDYDIYFKSLEERCNNIVLRLQERQEIITKIKNNVITDQFESRGYQLRLRAWNQKWSQLNSNQGVFDVEERIVSEQPNSYPGIGLKAWGSLTERSFNCLIRYGLPAAIWYRNQNEQLSQAIIETTINNLLRNDINQLPNELSRIRREANGNPQEVASHLSLLWDDSTRPLPPESYPLEFA